MADITDYTALWNEQREKISLVKSGNPTPGQGSFAHLTSGYDAGYYGCVCLLPHSYRMANPFWCRYTYALVFAADMYATVFEGDPLNPTRGARYRDKILRPGGSRDEIDSLRVSEQCQLFGRRVIWVY